MKVKESEKAGLKLNIQKTKLLASGLITSWQIDGGIMEIVHFFWGAPKSLQMVTAVMKLKDTHSLEEKLLKKSLEEKTNLDSLLKSRDNTLPTKVCLVKAMVFLIVTYGYESWTIKKTEH